MGKENTGIPWSRGYYDLERGRPSYPTANTINATLLDKYGKRMDLGRMEVELISMGKTLEAILLVLNELAGTNIKKEDI